MDFATINIRNASYTVSGTIDCEIEHDEFGWVPFHANPSDDEPQGLIIFDRCEAELTVAAYVADMAAVRGATVVPRVDVVSAMIADDPTNTSRTAELEAWALQNTIPASAQAIFDALPLADRAAAMRNDTLSRSSALIAPFAAVYGYTTDAQIDALFGIS